MQIYESHQTRILNSLTHKKTPWHEGFLYSRFLYFLPIIVVAAGDKAEQGTTY
jgi:hypothetical protein